jgi:hypothetical protein
MQDYRRRQSDRAGPMRRLTRAAGIAATAGLLAAPMGAQVAYDGGAPNGFAGWNVFNGTRSADDFVVRSALQFNTIRFWGLLPATVGHAPTMFWEILSDASGLPGFTSVASGSQDAVSARRGPGQFSGTTSWQFDFAVGPQTLGPGTFWLALHDGGLTDVTFSGLVWETTDAGHGADFAVEDFGLWSGGWSGNLAFQLLDVTAVPEPGTLALTLSGLAVLAALARGRARPSRSEES